MEIGSQNPPYPATNFSPSTTKQEALNTPATKDNPQNTTNESNKAVKPGTETEAKTKYDEKNTQPKTAEQQLTQEEVKQLNDLKARDREVHAHEAAHKAAAGQYATGGASFSYQRGPDGQRYAVGGEVGISTSPIADNPEATLRKANQIRAAALAPAQPSGQDMAVAAQASVMAAEAQAEIANRNSEVPQQKLNNDKDENTNKDKISAAERYKQVAQLGDDSPPLFDQTA